MPFSCEVRILEFWYILTLGKSFDLGLPRLFSRSGCNHGVDCQSQKDTKRINGNHGNHGNHQYIHLPRYINDTCWPHQPWTWHHLAPGLLDEVMEIAPCEEAGTGVVSPVPHQDEPFGFHGGDPHSAD